MPFKRRAQEFAAGPLPAATPPLLFDATTLKECYGSPASPLTSVFSPIAPSVPAMRHGSRCGAGRRSHVLPRRYAAEARRSFISLRDSPFHAHGAALTPPPFLRTSPIAAFMPSHRLIIPASFTPRCASFLSPGEDIYRACYLLRAAPAPECRRAVCAAAYICQHASPRHILILIAARAVAPCWLVEIVRSFLLHFSEFSYCSASFFRHAPPSLSARRLRCHAVSGCPCAVFRRACLSPKRPADCRG